MARGGRCSQGAARFNVRDAAPGAARTARGDYEPLSRKELLAVIEPLEARIATLEARVRRLDRLLTQRCRDHALRRFAEHLTRHRPELLWFLHELELEPTNWPAEQAIRPAVVNRLRPPALVGLSFGGNRTTAGAHALEVLASIIATGRQHGRDALDYLSRLLRLPPFRYPDSVPLPLPAPSGR